MRTSQVVLVVKNPPTNAVDISNTGSIPGSERSPGERNGNPIQYSCLENPMDRGAWWATVHGVTKSQTWLRNLASKPASKEWGHHRFTAWKHINTMYIHSVPPSSIKLKLVLSSNCYSFFLPNFLSTILFAWHVKDWRSIGVCPEVS